jgi:hypothetical protein
MMTWGKLAKNIRSRLYPAVALTSVSFALLAGMGLVFGWWQVEIVSTKTETLPAIASPEGRTSEQDEEQDDRSNLSIAAEPQAPTESSNAAVPAKPATATAKLDPADAAARRGALRVSNQTEHPIRVALLTRLPKAKAAQSARAGDPSAYAAPAHWDFAPNEGANRGLLLSLPSVNLKIKKGDILVAFAQDGSRRYWGPYVVGETVSPSWNNQTAEWQLVLQP